AGVDDPAAAPGNSYPVALSNTGEVLGDYFDGTSYHGLVTSDGVNFADISDPSAGSDGSQGQGTFVSAINATGEVIGTYVDANNNSQAFLFDGTNYLDLVDPNAAPNTTYAVTINSAGQVLGEYFDGTSYHGFVT